jgi:hypothetical protein
MSAFEEISKSFLILIVAPVLAIIVFLFGYHSMALLNQESHLKEIGFIPGSAKNVVYKSNGHWDFHGDGSTFLTFTCSPSDLKRLQAWVFVPDIVWRESPLDEPSIETMQLTAEQLDIESEQLPDLKSASLLFWSAGLLGSRIYVTMYMIDTSTNRFWYFHNAF